MDSSALPAGVSAGLPAGFPLGLFAPADREVAYAELAASAPGEFPPRTPAALAAQVRLFGVLWQLGDDHLAEFFAPVLFYNEIPSNFVIATADPTDPANTADPADPAPPAELASKIFDLAKYSLLCSFVTYGPRRFRRAGGAPAHLPGYSPERFFKFLRLCWFVAEELREDSGLFLALDGAASVTKYNGLRRAKRRAAAIEMLSKIALLPADPVDLEEP